MAILVCGQRPLYRDTCLCLLYRRDKSSADGHGYKGSQERTPPGFPFTPILPKSLHINYFVKEKKKWMCYRYSPSPTLQPERNVNVVLAFSALPSSLDLVRSLHFQSGLGMKTSAGGKSQRKPLSSADVAGVEVRTLIQST